jgi:uncharacterized membrane protein
LIFTLTLVAALGSGLIAGVFFAFSAFVMKSLAGLAPSEGIAAMQSINRVILTSSFMAVFLGTALLCIVALVCSFLRWREPDAVYLLVGGALYLVGSFLVTIVFNVPRNIALDSLKPANAASVDQWADYLEKWTAWNHVRTIASLAAAASFSMALGC